MINLINLFLASSDTPVITDPVNPIDKIPGGPGDPITNPIAIVIVVLIGLIIIIPLFVYIIKYIINDIKNTRKKVD